MGKNKSSPRLATTSVDECCPFLLWPIILYAIQIIFKLEGTVLTDDSREDFYVKKCYISL